METKVSTTDGLTMPMMLSDAGLETQGEVWVAWILSCLMSEEEVGTSAVG